MPKTAGTTLDKQTVHSAPNLARKRPILALAATCLLSFATAAAAQSPHGCTGLEQAPVPSIEGLNGMFYRIDPDLVMDTRLPDSMIRDIQKLSLALDSRGTKLVYVPVATKGLALPRYLSHDADRFGYDVRLARALYADSIAQLLSLIHI